MLELRPSLPEFLRLARKGNVVPVVAEFLGDTLTPVAALLRLPDEPQVFLFESVEGQARWARYSFLGCGAHRVFTCRGQEIQIEGGPRPVRRSVKGNPLLALRDLLRDYKAVPVKGLPRFHGGAVGFMGYDCVRFFEPQSQLATANKKQKRKESSKTDASQWPDAVFILTKSLIVFDNVRHQVQLIQNVYLPPKMKRAGLERLYAKATQEIQELYRRLTALDSGRPRKPKSSGSTSLRRQVTEREFVRRVQAAKKYVYNGDIVQVVLSNRFEGKSSVSPIGVYRALRTMNPSPYLFYVRQKDQILVGSSPETLVRLESGRVTVRPIAGTRRRGKNESEDLRLERELLEDPKENAEHVMLVDLGRNDVGRVARGGSVAVSQLMSIERYSHVMHIVSQVEGDLRKGLDGFDLLSSVFPAGTLSGAPKVRAMQIIHELEDAARGPYGGAVGYVSFTGDLDFCITIRTLAFRGQHLRLQAGAGIVADSSPRAEFQECENKAKALLRALRMAEKWERS